MIQKRTSISILFFSLLGALAAGFSLYEHTLLHAGVSAPSLCNIGAQFNCDAINKSPYSTIMGVPLASLGLAYYLLAAAGGIVTLGSGLGLASLGVYLLASTFSVALSAYLFFISKFVIGYFCLFCMIMYLSNIALFIATVRAAAGSIGHVISQGLFAPGEFVINLLSGAKRKQAWLFLALGAAALFFVYTAPSLFLRGEKDKQNTQAQGYISLWRREPVSSLTIERGGSLAGDYSKGAAEPVVEIVEYSDFECPACRMFYSRVEKLLEKFPTKVSFTAKNFPLDKTCNHLLPNELHVNSCQIALFTRCAGEQGKFWEAYHQAFTDPELEKEGVRGIPSLLSWANANGLDADALKSCMQSDRQMQKIKKEIDEGAALNLQSTPTVFVNGRKTSPQYLEAIVEALLQQ